MKKKLLFVITLFSIFSCTLSGDKLEKEFMQYVEENFDDPDALDEIVSITVRDTISYDSISNLANNYIKTFDSMDSIYSHKIITFSEEFQKHHKRNYTSYERSLVAPTLIESYNFVKKHGLDYAYSSEALKELLAKNDSTLDSIYYVNYVIKVRQYDSEGKLYLKKYYASVNKKGEIKFYNRDIKKSDLPQKLQELYSALDDMIEKFNARKENYEKSEKMYELMNSF